VPKIQKRDKFSGLGNATPGRRVNRGRNKGTFLGTKWRAAHRQVLTRKKRSGDRMTESKESCSKFKTVNLSEKRREGGGLCTGYVNGLVTGALRGCSHA